jgi:hypothetical protein
MYSFRSIHQRNVNQKSIIFFYIAIACNIGLWFCNIAYELLTNKAVAYTTFSHNTNASPICIIDDSNQVEIGYIINSKISHACQYDPKLYMFIT